MNFENAGDENDVGKIIPKFDDFTVGEINVTYERYIFNSRNKKADESVDKYVSDLRTLARTCDFSDLADSLIKDRIVLGIDDSDVRKKLLETKELNLSTCINICRAAESSSRQLKSMSADASCTVNKVNGSDQTKKNFSGAKTTASRNYRSRNSGGRGEPMNCRYCGAQHPRDRAFCSAWGKTCNNCGLSNHFASVCKQPKGRKVNRIEQSDDDSEYESIQNVYSDKNCVKNDIYAEMSIGGRSIRFQIDSGASANLIPIKYVKNIKEIRPTTKKLKMWNNSVLNPVGKIRLAVVNMHNKRRYSLEFIVVNERLTPIIGSQSAQLMQLITVNNNNFLRVNQIEGQSPEVNSILSEYEDVFRKEVGTLPGVVHLNVDRNAVPAVMPIRRIPHALKNRVKLKIDSLVNNGVLASVDEPTPWVNCPVIAEKKSGDKHLNQALEGLEGTYCIHDDIILVGVGTTIEQAIADHNKKLRALLQRCREKQIALNLEKLELFKKGVPFIGHKLTDNGLEADQSKIEAILKMPAPTDVAGIQRINGMVNYLAKFLPNLSDALGPLRKLTRKDTEWSWGPDQESAFAKVKELVTKTPVLAYYDPNKELTLQCDSSQSGLGASLMQKGRPIAYSSRALTDAETRYAQIEKETLAIVYGLEKFNTYTYGRKVTVESDHKPIEAIVKKPLSRAPKRLQAMLLRVYKYDVEIKFTPGSKMFIADTLSRAYLDSGSETAEFDSINMVRYLPISAARLSEIRDETDKDDTMQILKEIILRGWPDERSSVPTEVTPYFSFRDELSIQNGIIFRGERAVIPKSMYNIIKDKIHSSHLGIESCLRRARESVYWPGMNAQMREYMLSCSLCREHDQAQSKEPMLIETPPANRPWEKIGVDLFNLKGEVYLITVDYFSNFWEVDRLVKSTKSTPVIAKLKAHFARYGIPDIIISDNGPQFASKEFRKFMIDWDIRHRPLNPYDSKSNGQAESAVKTAKRLLKKAYEAKRDPYLAILDFRNTPTQGLNVSPVQRFMNRRTKTMMPTTANLLRPKISLSDGSEKKRKQAEYFNQSAKNLKPLDEGDIVRMKPFPGHGTNLKATVTERVGNRSYLVETGDNKTYRRARHHLRKTNETTVEPAVDSDNTVENRPISEPVANETSVSDSQNLSRPERQRRPPTYLTDYVCN
ncbi:uncharacterized protein LOC141909154 [Tubulanus polymorphus]|uniref:uncharacterized protein LOC141909154 n=1 Tax=Tubulanus polymorphus TaxID=672921 RepID=UPI003DA2F4C6